MSHLFRRSWFGLEKELCLMSLLFVCLPAGQTSCCPQNLLICFVKLAQSWKYSRATASAPPPACPHFYDLPRANQRIPPGPNCPLCTRRPEHSFHPPASSGSNPHVLSPSELPSDAQVLLLVLTNNCKFAPFSLCLVVYQPLRHLNSVEPSVPLTLT